MVAVNKIDSNYTGLRYAEEETPGVLPATPIWYPLEPNEYDDFGGELKTTARNPINSSRQRRKGVPVDLDAKAGFSTDLTYNNLQDLMQGFLFADFRTKNELAVADVDGTGNAYEPASGGDAYVAGDLLFAKGADDNLNNGLKVVTGVPAAASIPVTDTGLVDGATQSITVSRVGFQFATGDVSLDANGGVSGFPALLSVTKDFEDLGLIPGEWVCLGDDAAANQFATAACNGFYRVKDVQPHVLTFDKAPYGVVDDAGATKDIRIIFGRVLKNESDVSLIKRRTYQLERTLGYADTTDIVPQSEYLPNCTMSVFEMTMEQGEKVDVSLEIMPTDQELRTAADGLKNGTRPTIVDSDAFNATSNLARFGIALVTEGNAAPDDLFAYMTEATLTIDNNVSANKAVGVLGAFDTSAGTFDVSMEVEAYFQNVTALQAARNNADVTVDWTFRLANQGITFDIPLISVGNALAEVEQDEAIKLPLEMEAGTAARYGIDHTLLLVFWDYLPDIAK